MSPRSPLSEYVKPPEVSSAALQVEWHEVRRRVRRHRQVRAGGAVVAALLVAGVAGVMMRGQAPALRPGQQVVASNGPRSLTLGDGSEVELAAGAEVGLLLADEEEMVLVLERGLARFEVSRRPARRFVVKADAIEVRVIGTKFSVRREGRDVEVAVQRGIVEVREGEVVRRLVRGERWVRTLQLRQVMVPVEEKVVEVAPLPLPRVVRRKASAGPLPDPLPLGEREPAAPASPVDSVAPVSPAPPAQELEPTPADTFAAAMRARGAGKAREAIVGFQQVCERWPSSAYAPMSAFEWGRLALDAQDDPRQAVRAFERTLELATSDSLVQDALARLAEAYARYDVVSCRRVQTEYLRRFPGGPHVRGVTKACPP